MSAIRSVDEPECRIVDLLIVVRTGALDCRKGRSYLFLRDFGGGNEASTLARPELGAVFQTWNSCARMQIAALPCGITNVKSPTILLIKPSSPRAGYHGKIYP